MSIARYVGGQRGIFKLEGRAPGVATSGGALHPSHGKLLLSGVGARSAQQRIEPSIEWRRAKTDWRRAIPRDMGEAPVPGLVFAATLPLDKRQWVFRAISDLGIDREIRAAEHHNRRLRCGRAVDRSNSSRSFAHISALSVTGPW
jgi:hypothetical protein